ncbi:UvrD-helicase domain-containing protein [Phytoactinopolyspora halotolerans]|uniref:DNA 3'-5' helicase n=1 Tax=Phytoactinopolyspora halotolerans TaxID=1981512 RepID=A0A6L9S9B7_9ACTN|nr:UvrD-helicase domain-containing protein [Phytoactinopolyspora halotolerans]NEE01214.1 UvrD-helicase domain-containing protein [Phytoactinopolyspora halotolerans]
MDAAARQLLIKLLASWRDWPEKRTWYLAEHIPDVISTGPEAGRNIEERVNLGVLHKHLDPEEWEALGLLLVQTDKHDQGPIAEFRAKANRDRAQVLAEERKARAAENRRQRDAERERIARERAAEKKQLMDRLHVEIEQRFLGTADWLRHNDPDHLITEDEYQRVVVDHITKWCRTTLTMPNGKAFVPDAEQALAIATSGRHALVGARAGSGKTATMVARSVFLIRACGVDPSSILMLAFNAAAADEMRHRLETMLPQGGIPHVMTFHALAHRIVHPSENLLFDQSESMRALSRYVQDVRDELMRTPGKEELVRDVMLAYFRRDWSRILERGDNLSAADQLAYRRHLQDESIKGDFVKSYGEKVIANILFSNGIAGDGRGAESYYGYEHDVRWNGQNYKPDFSIYDQNKKRRIVIEYFGLQGDPDYDQLSQAKREFWADRDEVFLEYFASDVAKPDFEERMLADLRAVGAPLHPLSDEELWHRIKKRALDRFTVATTTIIGRARQRRWTGNDLRQTWSSLGMDDPDLDRFIDLGAQLLDAYAASLAADAKEDFSGLMWRAVDEVRAGTTSFGRGGRVDGELSTLEHIVVDEFQDFSLMFFELLDAILQTAPKCRVMAVGDDWQAINEFAGSSTAYFSSFEAKFQDAARLALTTNRRSAPAIVTLGNTVMQGRGAPARAARTEPGHLREFTLDTFDPSPIEAAAFGEHDREAPALLRLIQDHRAEGRNVAVLSRKRRGTWTGNLNEDPRTFSEFTAYGAYLQKILDIEEPEELRFSSTHGFKGQEADAVILVDVTQRNYPLIHPTWTLFQVFGDTIQTLTEAERRLFYVGVSRPHMHLDVVTTNLDPSEFWTEARGSNAFIQGDWESLPEVRVPGADGHVEIRVYNSLVEDFDKSKELLKQDRFRFRGGTAKYWWRLVPADAWDSEGLLRAPWAQHPGVRIEAWRDSQRDFEHRVPGGRQAWGPF